MFMLTLLLAGQLLDRPEQDGKIVDRYLQRCAADYEATERNTTAALNGEEPFRSLGSFVNSLPEKDRPLARIVCRSWLRGIKYHIDTHPAAVRSR